MHGQLCLGAKTKNQSAQHEKVLACIGMPVDQETAGKSGRHPEKRRTVSCFVVKPQRVYSSSHNLVPR